MSPRVPAHPKEVDIRDSNFDLSYFCIEKETLELAMKELSLPNRFIEVVEESPRRKIGSISFERGSDWTTPVKKTAMMLSNYVVLRSGMCFLICF